MSEAVFAPAVPIDGPLPVAPRFNILTVAQEAGDVLERDGSVSERWGGGVQVYPYPDGTPSGFDPCSAGTLRLKDEGEAVPLPVFKAFTAYLAIRCTAGGIGDDDEFRSRAVAALAATEAYAIERQLAYGDPMGGNPFLNDAAVVTVGGAGLSPLRALAVLEDEIGRTGRAGVLHMTPSVASFLGDRLWRDSSILRSPVGTPIVVGYGYTTAADDDDQTMWATGPLLYKHSDVIVNPPSIREALDRVTNDVVYRAERDVLIAWDTLLQARARVDLDTP